MKNFKLLLIGVLSSLFITSCLVEDEDSSNAQGLYDSPNIANFSDNTVNLVFTPSSAPEQKSTRVNYITDLPISNVDASFRFEVNTAETTIASSDYEIQTSADYIFNIPAGEEVAEGWFDYTVFPENISVGEVNYLVVDLIKVTGAGSTEGGKLIVTINKCDPPLLGDATVANYNEPATPGFTAPNGNTNSIEALDCDGNYRINRLEPFGNDYWWTINHNTDTNEVTITDFQFQGSNPLTGSGTYDPNTNTISFSSMAVAGVSWYVDVSFDLEL